jgi:restriction system protein
MSFRESADSAVIQAVARPPDLLLQAVIVPGNHVSDGRIIESVAPAWLEIARLMQRDPSAIYQIDDRKWEEIIAGAYKKAGFEEVILTPRSGDFGRDVIAVKYGLCTVRVVDQVKAYKPGHLVTANDVRALVGVLLSDRAATHGLVTTTSDFAPRIRDDPSIQPHLPNRLQLINGSELLKRLNDLAGK